MIIWLDKCLRCVFFFYCHDTNFENRPCKREEESCRRCNGTVKKGDGNFNFCLECGLAIEK